MNNKLKSNDYMDHIRENFNKIFPCVIHVRDSKITESKIYIYTRKCKQPKCERMYILQHKREYVKENGSEKESSKEKIFSIKYKGYMEHTIEIATRLQGTNRVKAKEQLKTQYVSDYRNKLMLETDLKLKNDGNLGNYKGTTVLDQVRKEVLQSQDDHPNDIEDLRIKIKRQSEEKQEVILHNLMVSPFTIYSISQDQLQVLKKLKSISNVLRASIDSSGNIVQTPQGIDGDVLYTAGVINILNKDGKCGFNYPFMEMLSTRNTAFDIKQFLDFLKK